MTRPPSEAVDLAAPFIPCLRPCSYGYLSLWKTVGWLLPGLLFIPNKFDRPRVASMRPFWIPGAMTL